MTTIRQTRLKFLWVGMLLVFTTPEGSPVGIMTEQLEIVTRATISAPFEAQTELRFSSGGRVFVREPLGVVLDAVNNAPAR